MMRICIIGGTGQQGYEQVIASLEHGYHVTAIGQSRSKERQERLTSEKLEWRQANLSSASEVELALEGADYLFINMPSSSFNDEDILLTMFDNLLEAAQKNNLKKIIFNTSMYVGEEPIAFQAPKVRRLMINRLKQASCPHVTVKPVIYMDNLLTAWTLPNLVKHRIFRYPHHEDLDVSWISLRDVAQIMLTLIKHEAFDGKELTIGGPESLKGPEIANHLSNALGHQIEFQSMPISEFGQIMANLFADKNTYDAEKLSAELVKVYSWYNTSPLEPFKVDMAILFETLNIKPTYFKDWAQQIDWENIQ
ncbi:MAG: SDR family oxidoreductase [Parvibaculales bacterium]